LRRFQDHWGTFANQVREGLDQAAGKIGREIIRNQVQSIQIEGQQVRITYRITPRPFAEGPSRAHCSNMVTAVYASFLREVPTKGEKARFRKTARGKFMLRRGREKADSSAEAPRRGASGRCGRWHP
jgi:hypothetical protein